MARSIHNSIDLSINGMPRQRVYLVVVAKVNGWMTARLMSQADTYDEIEAMTKAYKSMWDNNEPEAEWFRDGSRIVRRKDLVQMYTMKVTIEDIRRLE